MHFLVASPWSLLLAHATCSCGQGRHRLFYGCGLGTLKTCSTVMVQTVAYYDNLPQDTLAASVYPYRFVPFYPGFNAIVNGVNTTWLPSTVPISQNQSFQVLAVRIAPLDRPVRRGARRAPPLACRVPEHPDAVHACPDGSLACLCPGVARLSLRVPVPAACTRPLAPRRPACHVARCECAAQPQVAKLRMCCSGIFFPLMRRACTQASVRLNFISSPYNFTAANFTQSGALLLTNLNATGPSPMGAQKRRSLMLCCTSLCTIVACTYFTHGPQHGSSLA